MTLKYWYPAHYRQPPLLPPRNDLVMQLLEITLDKPAENVALDEALLEEAERTGAAAECLRLWESPAPLVVVGRATRVDREVNRSACKRQEIPIIRRTSGGASVVCAPGCLMYALILSYERRPALRIIERAHCFVLETLREALNQLVPDVSIAGTSDLAIGVETPLKFSGNSLRCKRSHLLYHGTLLYDFPLDLISNCLTMPPRQPTYREGRSHADFLTNLPLTAEALRSAMIGAWRPTDVRSDWPEASTVELVTEKYSQPEWNYRL
jgi:lipoate-protein ligase A